jgi:hypothetical protein
VTFFQAMCDLVVDTIFADLHIGPPLLIKQVRDLAYKARGPRPQELGIADHTYSTPLRSTVTAFLKGRGGGGGAAASAASAAAAVATPGGGGGGKRPAVATAATSKAEEGKEDGVGASKKKRGSITDFFGKKKS